MTIDYPTTITGHASQDQASAHREDGNFVVWLMRMARNAYNDHLRYQRHRSINNTFAKLMKKRSQEVR